MSMSRNCYRDSHLCIMELRGQTGDVFTQLDVLSLGLVQQTRHTVQLQLQEKRRKEKEGD